MEPMGIKAKSYRFDDEVRLKLAELRGVYGTDNAAMRAVFRLSPKRVDFASPDELVFAADQRERYEPLLKPGERGRK